MSEDAFLSDDLLSQITAAGDADILVSVPTLNNAKTIEQVVRAVQVGLVKYFPRERAAIIVPDGGSKDGTPDLVRSLSMVDYRTLLTAPPLRTMHTLTTSYASAAGQGMALHLTFAAADLLRAKACGVVSADLESITPEWIESLIRPVYREKFDFVSPIYQRHKFDALMQGHVLAPFLAATYGYEVQEPYAGEFALSGRLGETFLNAEAWRRDFMRYGAQIWMIAHAMSGGFRLCQSFLGPKIHVNRASGLDLSEAIQQVVGALFNCLEADQSLWMARDKVETVPVFGFRYDVDLRPLRVERKKMFQMFGTGVEHLGTVLEQILAPETLGRVREIAKLSEAEFRLPDELWVKINYDFAASFHRSVMNRDHILQALTPLYRGRISSFLRENHEARVQEVRERLRALRIQFEQLKPYLIERWNAGA